MLISDTTIENINLIIQAMFNHNRTLDRFLCYSDAEWAFTHFNSVYHQGYAHLMPLVADKFSDILLRYNIAPKYYETKSDTRTYTTMLDFFQTNLEEHEATYELIKKSIEEALDNGDYNVEADLKHLLRMWNKFMAQAILLRDKAQVYGENNKAMFDGFADQFYILQNEYKELTGEDYKD